MSKLLTCLTKNAHRVTRFRVVIFGSLVPAILLLSISCSERPTVSISGDLYLVDPGEYAEDGNYTLIWGAVKPDSRYLIEEDNHEFFTSPDTVYSGVETSVELVSKPSGVYFYRLACDDPATRGTWSNVVDIIVADSGTLCIVAPPVLDFGSVAVGDSTQLAFTMTYVGDSSFSWEMYSSCGDFKTISTYLGSPHTFTVEFVPTDIGDRTCVLETGNDLCSDVTFIGTGIPAR